MPRHRFCAHGRYRVDDLLRLVVYQVDHNQGDKDCLNKTVGVLEEALAAPGKKSSAISELRDRLNRLGFQAHPRIPTSARPGDDASDTWIAHFASLPRNTAAGDRERSRAEIAAQTGLDIRVLDSSDFASLTPGYWVIYHPDTLLTATRRSRPAGRTAATRRGRASVDTSVTSSSTGSWSVGSRMPLIPGTAPATDLIYRGA
jgi:hypothetical protein